MGLENVEKSSDPRYVTGMKDRVRLNPFHHGFCMPPEWASHAATWMAWPHNDELWMGYLDAVRDEFTNFINTVAQHERIDLLVANKECEADAKSRLRGDVHFHSLEYSDVWLRDSGPIFVTNPNSESLIIDWDFNGWGEKYDYVADNQIPSHVAKFLKATAVNPGIVMEGGSLDVNGTGCLITTKQCLLSPARNPNHELSEIETCLQRYLGASKIIWLEDGLENDHTDGHVDTISRFASPGVIVSCICEDRDDPNYATMQNNLDILRSSKDEEGKSFSIIELPLPRRRLELEGERLAPTYANFYICNGLVVVPQYNDLNDAKALEILRPLFPGRKVVGLPGRALITGGGSFHCVTQQQPSGVMWR